MSPAPKKPPSKKKKSSPGKAISKSAMNAGQKKILLGGGAIAAFLIYRHLHSGTATAASTGNSSATGSITPYTPQSPVVIPSGESIYDPNTGGLLTAPGSDSSTTYSDAPAQLSPAQVGQLPGAAVLAPVSTTKTATKATKRKMTSKRVTAAKPGGGTRTIPKMPAKTKTPKRSLGKAVRKVKTKNG